MAREVCQQIVANIIGREVSETDLMRLEQRVQARMRALQRQDATLSENTAMRQSVDDIVAQDAAAITAKRRATLMNQAKLLQTQGQITANWGKQYGLGVKSLITGTQRNVKGARRSVGGEQHSAEVTLQGGLHGGITQLGKEAWEIFRKDLMESDIARALWHLQREIPNTAELAKLPEMAVAIAKVIDRQQEMGRLMANQEGASIGRYDGRITKGSHDTRKIGADEAGWMDSARRNFDLPRMMDEMGFTDPQDMLRALYEPLSTGLHLKVTEPPSPTVKRGLGTLANKLSKEKVVHFKGPDEFMAYNKQFGAGNLRESVAHELSQAARSVGLLRMMGTNPNAFIDALETNLKKELRKTKPTADAVTRFNRDISAARQRLKTVDGSNNIPGGNVLGNAGLIYRTLKTVSTLGGSMISSFGDVATFIQSARYNGINGFQAFDAALRGIFTARQPLERAELASSLGVMFDSLSGHIANRFSFDDGFTGAGSKVLQLYYKANLQNWWTDGLRFAAAQMLSHNLAFNAGKAFNELDPALVKTLNLYGIDEAGWNLARQAVRNRGGTAYLAPELIKDEAVQRAMRAYFSDQNGYLLLSPDAETRHFTTWGTQKGTLAGEVARLAMQFKAYNVSFNQRMIGRELLGNIGVDTRGVADVLKGSAMSQSAWLGMTKLMALTTLFGYASMYAKSTLRGLTPRDPTDPHTAVAAALQGGGLGVMGDFMFANASRTGSDPLINALGPAVGDLDSVTKLFLSMREASLEPDADKRQQELQSIGDKLFQMGRSNVPGNNLFFLKPIIDYLFMWNWQEQMNPGAMQRMEANAAKNGQTYFISPTQRVAQQRAGAMP